MKAITNEETMKWCSQDAVGLKMTRNDVLRYKDPDEHKFFVTIPEEHREIVVLARTMLTFRGEVNFSGGMLWLRWWEIGSPQLARVGWRILEDIRRAHGESRSLEVAPSQLFRDDEFVELHAFLTQVMCFGWVAEYVPSTDGFFLHFKDNRQVCFFARAAETLQELRTALKEWNPTDEDPMVVKMAAMEKAHKANKK
jgi:hypothetical protein